MMTTMMRSGDGSTYEHDDDERRGAVVADESSAVADETTSTCGEVEVGGGGEYDPDTTIPRQAGEYEDGSARDRGMLKLKVLGSNYADDVDGGGAGAENMCRLRGRSRLGLPVYMCSEERVGQCRFRIAGAVSTECVLCVPCDGYNACMSEEAHDDLTINTSLEDGEGDRK